MGVLLERSAMWKRMKRNHQILGEIEHVQRGVSIKRIALLDSLTHHLRFQDVTDRMSDEEKEGLNVGYCKERVHKISESFD